MVTVYTKNNCVQCTATKKYLEENGIDAVYLNVEYDEIHYEEAIATGFKQMPIVVTESDTWSGFDPLKLEALRA